MEEAAQLCDRLVIMDHGKILVEGTPAGVDRGACRQLDHRDERRRPGTAGNFSAERAIAFDELGERLIIYNNGECRNRTGHPRRLSLPEQCTFRSATLEDVFLRLTGRELRE